MAEPASLEEQVMAAQRGDTVALAAALACCHPELHARAAARLDPATRGRFAPEDVLQDVYAQVFRQIERFEYRGPGSFLAWTEAILDRRLVDLQRAAHRQMRDVGREVAPVAGCGAAGSSSESFWNLLDEAYADAETPSRVVRRAEAIGALQTCLAGLAPDYRQVLQLRYIESRPLGEVAAQLGRTEAATAVLCHRALRHLRAAMDRLGEFTAGH